MRKEFTLLKKSFDEYMKRSKEELAAMLALSECMGEKIECQEKEVKFPDWVKEMQPIRGFGGCTSMETCTNPQMDCINCPFRGKTQYKRSTTGTGDSLTINPFGGSFSNTSNTPHRDDFQITC